MSLTHYVLLFTLAEALAVTAILALVFGIKWWRLRQRYRRFLETNRTITRLLRQEIARQADRPNPRPEIRETHLACLQSLAVPFGKQHSNDAQTWGRVLTGFEQCFEALAQATDARSETSDPVRAADSSKHLETLASTALDSDMEALVSQYRRSMSSLAANHETMTQLRTKYAQLQRVNQTLRAKLDTVLPRDDASQFREELEQAVSCNLELMKAALGSKRSFNILTQQCHALEEHIEQLQNTIKRYRRSAHQLILEREGRAEEMKALTAQLEMRERLVERLNRNYRALREEYNKLYGVTQ